MRRLVVGLALLALAASTFSWALADDQEIARKVAERLKQEQKEGKLRGFDINLKVAEGTVTLKGNVASAEQKELAVGLVRQVDGVKDIEDGLQVKTVAAEAGLSNSRGATSATPAPARKTLLSSLFPSPSTGESPAACDAQKKSSKPNEAAKPAVTAASAPATAPASAPEAAPAASAASTLGRVPTAKKLDETQIAADRRIGEEVTRQLQNAKGSGQLKGFGMSVHVENGNVWLKGRVGSAAQQQMVLDLARRTEGVRQVINELTVGESAANIAQNLQQVLQTAESGGAFRGANLNAKVDGPDVWLTGTISKPEQEQLAVDLARKVPGVRRVISGLELNQVSRASLASPTHMALPAAVPSPAPVASLLPPRAIATRPSDTPQSGPATPASPPQMAMVAPPEVKAPDSAEANAGMQPIPAVRFTKQAVALTEATTQAETAPVPTPSVAEAPVAAPSAPMSSIAPEAVMPAPVAMQQAPEAMQPAPVAMMPVPATMPPAPVAPNPQPAVGGYVYYNQYPVTQAPMPMVAMDQTPRPLGLPQMASYAGAMAVAPVVAISQATGMMPAQLPGPGYGAVPARYDQPSLPGYAWPTYAAHPNYAAVTYPKQYSPSAWPYIGPFYPYPQVPLGWRKVTLKWDDGWWNLDFKAK